MCVAHFFQLPGNTPAVNEMGAMLICTLGVVMFSAAFSDAPIVRPTDNASFLAGAVDRGHRPVDRDGPEIEWSQESAGRC